MEYTFKQFQTEYPDDGACLDKIMMEQYGGKELDCPACRTRAKFHRITKRRAFACQNCGHHIYPCVGTIFEKSRTPLTNWFFAMYLMTSTRHGVAAKELERQIGCTYKTAWRMAHELRKLMANADGAPKLSGVVEVDETFMGGKVANRHVSKRGKGKGPGPGGFGSGKTPVVGAVSREGKIVARVVERTDTATLDGFVRDVVANDVSLIATDENAGYRLLKNAYRHGFVRHGREEYVVGDVHTNTIEGHWGLFKRAVRGTHVHVSKKHLWKYVAEFSYRRNYRDSHSEMFNRLMSFFALPERLEC